MDELPLLVLQEIFSFLDWKERLKCKRVSKQWKFAIETTGTQSLCIYSGRFPYKLKWCFSERELIREDTVYCDPDKFGNLRSKIELFRTLQKLCFFHVEMNEFIEDLHLLPNLKVLMIHDYKVKRERNLANLKLSSSSLEKLSFKYFKTEHPFEMIDSIDLDTPNLSSLIFWNDAITEPFANFPIKFRSPLKIQHLECIEFDSKLSVLKNLETLVCQKIVCPFTLEDFKMLQRLELFPAEEEELDYIRGIMKEKNNLRKDSLEITVCGFKDLLVAFKHGYRLFFSNFELNEHFLSQVAKHSENLVGYIPWDFNVYFSVFHKIFEEIPKNFFKKFSNFKRIYFSDYTRRLRKRKFPNQSEILQLLIQSNPKVVDLGWDFYFNLEFYEQLTSIKSIRHLEINDKFENLDYELFLKLEFLESLSIRTEKLPVDFIKKLFKLKFMYNFSFCYSRFRLSVMLCQTYYSYSIDLTRKKDFDMIIDMNFYFLDDLIEEIKKLKSENRAFIRGSLL